MGAWITDEGEDIPFEFRAHVSMMGALGIGGNLLKWPGHQLAAVASAVERYKQWRPLIAGGDLYRLISPRLGSVSARLYVAKDKSEGLLFVFSEADSRDARELVVPIPGLHPGMVYKIDGSDLRLSGAAWATKGLTIRLKAFESRILTVRCV